MFSLEQRMMEWWTSKSSLYLEDHCFCRGLPLSYRKAGFSLSLTIYAQMLLSA